MRSEGLRGLTYSGTRGHSQGDDTMQTSSSRGLLIVTAFLALLIRHAVAQEPPMPAHQPAPAAAAHARIAHAYAQLPLAFEPNLGQTDRRVKFLARTAGGTLFLTNTEAVLALPVHPAQNTTLRPLGPALRPNRATYKTTKVAVLRMKLAGANRTGRVAGLERLPGIVNYFRGRDPGQWRTNVPTYRKARVAGVYP